MQVTFQAVKGGDFIQGAWIFKHLDERVASGKGSGAADAPPLMQANTFASISP